MKRSKTEIAMMESRAVKVALYLALGSFVIPCVLVFTSVALGRRPYSKNPLIDALIDCFVGWLLLAPPVLFWYLVFAVTAVRSHSNTTKPDPVSDVCPPPSALGATEPKTDETKSSQQ